MAKTLPQEKGLENDGEAAMVSVVTGARVFLTIDASRLRVVIFAGGPATSWEEVEKRASQALHVSLDHLYNPTLTSLPQEVCELRH